MQVKGIERIQNPKLWAKYVLRRQEVSDARGGDPNEMKLFHGADRLTLQVTSNLLHILQGRTHGLT